MKKLLLVAGCLLLAAGCAHSSAPSPRDASKQDVVVRRRRVTAADTIVRHAHLPIDYLITAPRIVRVNDLTTNTQIWQRHVAENSRLLVDARGIHVNTAKVYRGKLKKGDVYEVVLIRPNGF